jgi:hypothetical protein
MQIQKTSLWLRGAGLLLVAALVLNGCKKKFDEPAPATDPNIQANTTIAQLKAMHTVFGAIDVINTDVIIEGIVVANDKSGNLYKEIYIQDSTGGLNVLLDANSLYTSFPVGRKVFIKANGLAISDYNRLVQLGVRAVVGGVPSVQGITSGLIDDYVIGGSLNNPVVPKVVTVSQLGTSMQDPYQGTLIQLNNYEFIAADTGKTWSDTSAYKNSVNLTVKGCTGNSNIIIRTSGFANFAGINVPNGNGTLVAIYTVFNTTKQLIVRDDEDAQFVNPRCGQGPTTVMNISDVRNLFTGTTTSAPDGKRITGVVISDRTTNNENGQNLYLQQGDNLSGIVVRFDAPHSFNLGDSLDINISQQEISEFNNLLQVNNVPLAYATRISTGKTITPRIVTLAQIAANFNTWEATLVKILNVTSLTGGTGGTYSGNVNMNDGTGTFVMRTSTSATFASQTYPSSAVSVTGYLSEFGPGKELHIRNPGGSVNDVVAGGGGGGTGLLLLSSPYVQTFNSISSGLPQGVYGKVGATSTSLGSGDAALFNALAATDWNNTSAGVKNFASATGLTSSSNSAAQAASTNRVFGFRQTGTIPTGGDPGFAFTFQLENTLGKSNFQMSFLLQQLDPTVPGATPRVTTWTVEYGLGDNPASFTNVVTVPPVLTTTFGTWISTPVTVNFGSALNNQNQKVWIRIVALNATTGSGSRGSAAVDDLTLTWN